METELSLDSNSEIKRVLWRCRRGTKELDVLLQDFAKTNYETLSEEDKLAFSELLDFEDPLLAQWLCLSDGSKNSNLENIPINQPNQEVVKIVSKILSTHND